MSKNSGEDDRQTRSTTLNFSINAAEKYDVKQPITCIREATNLITNAIIDSYNKDVEGKYDVESIKEIKVQLGGFFNTSVKVDLVFYSWETKNQMYNRRSSEKRDRELKEQKLAQEAKLLGFKLEKVNHTPAATDEQCGYY